MTQTIRKSALVLILAFLTVNAGNALAYSSIFPPSQPTPDGGGGGGNPGGGNPNPCTDGSCLVAIH
jgi:hypothetical protein